MEFRVDINLCLLKLLNVFGDFRVEQHGMSYNVGESNSFGSFHCFFPLSCTQCLNNMNAFETTVVACRGDLGRNFLSFPSFSIFSSYYYITPSSIFNFYNCTWGYASWFFITFVFWINLFNGVLIRLSLYYRSWGPQSLAWYQSKYYPHLRILSWLSQWELVSGQSLSQFQHRKSLYQLM